MNKFLIHFISVYFVFTYNQTSNSDHLSRVTTNSFKSTFLQRPIPYNGYSELVPKSGRYWRLSWVSPHPPPPPPPPHPRGSKIYHKFVHIFPANIIFILKFPYFGLFSGKCNEHPNANWRYGTLLRGKFPPIR